MRSGQFCPQCGADVPDREEPLPGEPSGRRARLCDACYLDDFDLVDAPDRVEITVCATCGAVKRGETWADVGAEDYTDVAVDAVREALGVHVDADDVTWGVEPEHVDETTIRMHCLFSGVVRGTAVEADLTVSVRMGRGSCDRCGRIAGGYHNALVQVRADGREPTSEERGRAVELAKEYVADREASGDRNAFLTSVERVDGGVDLKISTTQMGQGIATRITDELGGSVETHPTLVTEDADGTEVYRVTYAVRLPRFAPDDVIDPGDGDGPVLVTGVSDRLTGVRLATGADYAASVDDAATPETSVIGRRTDAEETALVTVEDDSAVRVIDPKTSETVTVPRPDYLEPDAGTVPVVRSRAGLHVVPETDRTDRKSE